MTHAPTIPLACLLALVAWTVGLVVALTIARFRHLRAGGSVREFGIPDDRRLVWRLFRAHANALENLPLFAAVVLAAAVMGRADRLLDGLAITYLGARMLHSLFHVAPGAGLRFHARLCFLVVQLGCVLAFVVALVLPA